MQNDSTETCKRQPHCDFALNTQITKAEGIWKHYRVIFYGYYININLSKHKQQRCMYNFIMLLKSTLRKMFS